MTPKERVLAAFRGERTDRIPVHHISFSSKAASYILGREAYVGGGVQQWREARALWEGEEAHQEFLERSRRDAFELAEILDMDIVRPSYWRLNVKPTKKLDEYTFLYGDPEGSWQVRRFDPETELYQVVDWSPKVKPTLEELERRVERELQAAYEYEPTEDSFPDIKAAIEYFKGEREIRAGGAGLGVPFGSEIWFEALALRPDIVDKHLQAQLIRAKKNVRVLAKMGVKLIFGGGDMADNRGPFYSPRLFRELLLPKLIELTQECEKYGVYYLFGSDGNLWDVADDLFGGSGVRGYYEIDRRAGMDLERLKERFPDLVLIGNISSHTLHLGTPDQVMEETASCIEAAKRWGGVIVGCSNLIVPQTPPENLFAMIEAIREMR